MNEDDATYHMFKLKNKEFTFDVDVSNLPCGLNGALYFVAMDPDGGVSRFPSNTAGAKFGTGYCDAQCPQDIKFINGEANLLEWNDTTATGKYGTCCVEMDIWEANSISSAYTPHPCTVTEQTRCEDPKTCGSGDQRYDGVCDKDGCDLNTFRLGDHGFFGTTLDTKQPMTVITQFVTADGTDSGALTEIRRKYVQNGKEFDSPTLTVGGKTVDSVSDDMCDAQKSAFGDTNDFKVKGGLGAMADQFDRGMALVLSLWDDEAVHMLWLDSNYPPTSPSSQPGVARGTCDPNGGDPATLRKQYPNSSVKYSNIKFGDIGSTYQH
jgi:cellulose 1,4-beta-cellobiosidase